MSGCIARNIAKFGMVAAAALGAVGATALPTVAAPAAAEQSITAGSALSAQAVTASYRCVITADYGWRWEGNCRIYSGELRTITYCANGTSTTGLWIGARSEPWAVWGNCPGSSWTRIVFQTRG
ncbi:hypothetical protein [Kitasatospora sp. NPDC091207]|uniref:hypothetical protein n=1 Tax=Kitasatospora sp. NPDC091207 TaxID=3364083 RepID=UPI003800E251